LSLSHLLHIVATILICPPWHTHEQLVVDLVGIGGVLPVLLLLLLLTFFGQRYELGLLYDTCMVGEFYQRI